MSTLLPHAKIWINFTEVILNERSLGTKNMSNSIYVKFKNYLW